MYSGCDQCDLIGDVVPGMKAHGYFRSSASLDADGSTPIWGLASTNTWVNVGGSETLYPVERTGLTVRPPTALTLTQRHIDPASRVTLRGNVTDQHGQALDGSLWLKDGLYEQEAELYDGRGFELSVPRGTYQLKLKLDAETAWNLDGEHSDYTDGVFITLDGLELTGDRTQNLTVPLIDFPVHVVTADGDPTRESVNGTSGQIAGRAEEGDAAVELFPGAVGYGMVENRNVDTDESGTAHLKILPGAAPPIVTAGQEVTWGQAKPARTAVEATIRLHRGASIGGALRGPRGPLTEPVRVDVAYYDDPYTTDSAWGFSAPPGRYTVQVGYPRGDDEDDDVEPVPGLTRPARWGIDGEFDLVDGDTTVDLTIPDADHADIWLYGPDGRPAWGGAATTAHSLTAGIVLAPGITARGHAESDPTGEVGHIRTPMFGPSTVALYGQARNWGSALAGFRLDPDASVHVVSAVRGTEPGDAPAATTPPTVTTPDPGAGTAATAPSTNGYWALSSDGRVYNFGDAPQLGNTAAGAIDLEPTPTGKGYWTLNRNGTVSPFGDATPLGNVEVAKLSKGEEPASLSATPSGRGYWVFTNKGRVLAFGDASFLGDMSQTKLNGPVLGSVATPSGKGYYLVASDGGIFAFGDAAFAGSMGGKKLNAPVQSLVPDSDGKGYWLVASDGGIFAFDAPFRGSMGETKLNKPVVGMVRYGDGYLMVGADGGIFNFSTSPFAGSLGDKPPASPVVAVAALP